MLLSLIVIFFIFLWYWFFIIRISYSNYESIGVKSLEGFFLIPKEIKKIPIYWKSNTYVSIYIRQKLPWVENHSSSIHFPIKKSWNNVINYYNHYFQNKENFLIDIKGDKITYRKENVKFELSITTEEINKVKISFATLTYFPWKKI